MICSSFYTRLLHFISIGFHYKIGCHLFKALSYIQYLGFNNSTYIRQKMTVSCHFSDSHDDCTRWKSTRYSSLSVLTFVHQMEFLYRLRQAHNCMIFPILIDIYCAKKCTDILYKQHHLIPGVADRIWRLCWIHWFDIVILNCTI